MRRTAWLAYLGVGAVTTGAYHLLAAPAQAVLNVLVGASAVGAIALGVRWHRPARRLAWWLILVAQGLFVLGDALFSINELVLGIEPFPSLADALYLPGPGHRAGPAGPEPVGQARLGRGGRLGHHRHRLRPALLGAGDGPLLPGPRARARRAARLARLPGRGRAAAGPGGQAGHPPRAGARSRSGC